LRKDLIGSIALLAVAGAYYFASTRILDTSLSDEVGARGLPAVLATLLALVAVAGAIRGMLASPAAPNAAPADEAEEEATPLRAIGLLAIGALYIPVAQIAGYIPAIVALLVAVALYERARPSWRMLVIALLGAGFFWLLFVGLLGVAQPEGMFWGRA
jgi:hypothetical protein